jgi:hypothetical protein
MVVGEQQQFLENYSRHYPNYQSSYERAGFKQPSSEESDEASPIGGYKSCVTPVQARSKAQN